VLPPRERFSSEEAFHRMAGPRKWNAQQGLYIYRAHRMIQNGGWSRMRALDEHLKLARASVDFFPELDSAFEINVAKVRAVLPAELKEALATSLESLASCAQRTYRAMPARSEATSKRDRFTAADSSLDSPARLRIALEQAARRTGEGKAFARIASELRSRDSAIARRLGL
jgi:hypothetical protein